MAHDEAGLPSGTDLERRVRLRRRLNAPPQRVFRAWADPEELARWLPMQIEGGLAVGARSVLTWADRRVWWQVTRAEPPSRFAFRQAVAPGRVARHGRGGGDSPRRVRDPHRARRRSLSSRCARSDRRLGGGHRALERCPRDAARAPRLQRRPAAEPLASVNATLCPPSCRRERPASDGSPTRRGEAMMPAAVPDEEGGAKRPPAIRAVGLAEGVR